VTLGIVEAFAKAEFILFPNPTSNDFQLIPPNTDVIHLKIYDLNGRVVLDYNDLNKNYPSMIFTAPDVSGIYLIQLSTKKGMQTQKLVVL
jgi:hypothetical protein